MVQPADVLLLDEPANDLDIQALEVLEESIEEFPGAVVLISHDRYFLNRLCNQILNLDGHGHAEYFADYFQWQKEMSRRKQIEKSLAQASESERSASEKNPPAPQKRKKFKQKELDQITSQIMKAEAELEAAQKKIQDPAIASNPAELATACAMMEDLQRRIEALYERWMELESSDRPSTYFKTFCKTQNQIFFEVLACYLHANGKPRCIFAEGDVQ
jgi:ATP-binding cassette subfamily F protein uup